MKLFHDDIAKSWQKMGICEQMANIGAEVGRALNWRKKGIKKMSITALYRALDLIDFTAKDIRNRSSLKEILRVRELIIDDLIGENIYCCTDEGWEKYFYWFAYIARKDK